MTIEFECLGDGGDGRTWVACASGETVTAFVRAAESTRVELRSTWLQGVPTQSCGTIEVGTREPEAEPTSQPRWTGKAVIKAPWLWPRRLSLITSEPTTTPALWLVPRFALVLSTLLVVAALTLTVFVLSPSLARLQVTLTGAITGISGAAILSLLWKIATWSGKTLLGKQLPWLGIAMLPQRAVVAAALIVFVPCGLHARYVTRIYNATDSNIEIARPGGMAEISPGNFLTVVGEQQCDLIHSIYGNERYCIADAPRCDEEVSWAEIFRLKHDEERARTRSCAEATYPSPSADTVWSSSVLQVQCATQPWGELGIDRTLGPKCKPLEDETQTLDASRAAPPFKLNSESNGTLSYTVMYPWSSGEHAVVTVCGTWTWESSQVMSIEPLNPSSVPHFVRTRIRPMPTCRPVEVPALRNDMDLAAFLEQGSSRVSTLRCHVADGLASGLVLARVTDPNIIQLELSDAGWSSAWRLNTSMGEPKPWMCVPNHIYRRLPQFRFPGIIPWLTETIALKLWGPDVTIDVTIDVTMKSSVRDATLPFPPSSSITLHQDGDTVSIVCDRRTFDIRLQRYDLKTESESIEKDAAVEVEIELSGVERSVKVLPTSKTVWLCNAAGGVEATVRHRSGARRRIEIRGGNKMIIESRICVLENGEPVLKLEKPPNVKKQLEVSQFADHQHCDEIWD